MVKVRLSESQRSEYDIDFYRTAERLQCASPLPNGCTAEEYDKKALAFILNIRLPLNFPNPVPKYPLFVPNTLPHFPPKLLPNNLELSLSVYIYISI